jgi:hypothetical protein
MAGSHVYLLTNDINRFNDFDLVLVFRRKNMIGRMERFATIAPFVRSPSHAFAVHFNPHPSLPPLKTTPGP